MGQNAESLKKEKRRIRRKGKGCYNMIAISK
jgi:hypothetical protein